MVWGLSPALDLLKEYERVHPLQKTEGELNILLIGSIDGRHILKTIANWTRHGTPIRVNFYVMDLAMEFVARQMALLTIALEPPDRLGLAEKTRLWMEVYGNTLLRPSTAKYLIHKAGQLVRMVTDRDFLEKRMPLLDLDLLRYKEKDHLENIFKYWMYNRYSMAKIWDNNLRKSLGTRYDCRMGVFDWDYNMKISDIPGGKRVCLGEYKLWRNTGIAFTWLETEYSIANPSLAVGIGVYGDQLYSHGYLGDMDSGPYFSFGTEVEEPTMLETRNGYNVRRATDITERHLQRLFTEIQTGSPPTDLYQANIDMGLVMLEPGNASLEPETSLDYEPDKSPEEYTAIPVQHRVIFMPGNTLQTLVKKAKYNKFFDMAYVSHNFFENYFSADLLLVMKPSCPVVVETRKFAIVYDKKRAEFGKEVKRKMNELGAKEVSKCFFTKHSYALFKINVEIGDDDTVNEDNQEEDKSSSDDDCSEESTKSGEEYEEVNIDKLEAPEVGDNRDELKCPTEDKGDSIIFENVRENGQDGCGIDKKIDMEF